jgi:hypothetical protein
LGHVLGHGHYSCAVSLMNGPSESCWYETPQALDTDNYHKAYHVDAVCCLFGWSPSPGEVGFTWGAGHVHNEKDFQIWRQTPPGYEWVLVGYAPKHGEFAAFCCQPPGDHLYSVWPRSFADHLHWEWGDPAWYWVFIQ